MHLTEKSLSCGSVTSCTKAEWKKDTCIHTPSPGNRTYLDGGLPCDVGDKEVHGDIFTVDVLVHHVSDGLGHHIRIQVGIILPGGKDWNTVKTSFTFSINHVWLYGLLGCVRGGAGVVPVGTQCWRLGTGTGMKSNLGADLHYGTCHVSACYLQSKSKHQEEATPSQRPAQRVGKLAKAFCEGQWSDLFISVVLGMEPRSLHTKVMLYHGVAGALHVQSGELFKVQLNISKG